ncbi:putative MFS transporter [Rhizopus microsporus ATCC 52813]|uniref:Putative MFS transporter n=1 Tax=Rhizopus microsporus ATCC 52813 TaxID=1340429 RepID=A0A2G4SRX5_RHIZD|nr:putative MFS transporter [Rhizopus microsporus ATCC 52813]PHZ11529.1 putative MFS transporter [Rhizopus microsporus ATCC 52813]
MARTVDHTDSSVTLQETNHSDTTATYEPVYSVFTKNAKVAITATVSLSAFFSPFSTNIYFPALHIIQRDLHTTEQLISLTVTMYMILQGISPSFWGAMADTWGRRPVYIATFLVYSLASAGAGCAQNYPGLLIMRMLQAVGSSSAIAVGAGTIGDISTPAERGGYMGVYSMLTQLGPLLGPFLGGLISQTLGWRWIFWILAIMSILLWFVLVIFLPETLRSLVGDGSGYANPTLLQYWRRSFRKQEHDGLSTTSRFDSATKNRFPNVFQSLTYLKEKDIAVLLFYNALQYSAIYSMLTSLTKLFTETYQLNTLQIGLCYLSSGFGSSLGSFSSGRLLNWQFSRYSRSYLSTKGEGSRKNLDPEFPIEAARLNLTWIWGVAFSLFTSAYGWCLQLKVNIAVPLTMTFFMAYTSSSTFCAINTLLVDLFPNNSAAIIASNNFTRCILGALAVFCVNPGVEFMGIGWFFTTVSLIVFVSRAILIVELKYGPKWRLQRTERSMVLLS